jgi:hypothetical protein
MSRPACTPPRGLHARSVFPAQGLDEPDEVGAEPLGVLEGVVDEAVGHLGRLDDAPGLVAEPGALAAGRPGRDVG